MKRKNSGGEESPTKKHKIIDDGPNDSTTESEKMDLLSLPVDIHAIIFLKVHTNDAGRARGVCKYMKEILDNVPDLRWAFLFQSNFGLPENAQPPGGLIWRKQYKYSVSVLKNIVSVRDVGRTREIATEITDVEAEQFKFEDLIEVLNKMPEKDRLAAREAKSTWAVRVSYYRLTEHLIRHGIFYEKDKTSRASFFPLTLQYGYEEVLNVLWNHQQYDPASLGEYLIMSVLRDGYTRNWSKKFIAAGANGEKLLTYAVTENNAKLVEAVIDAGVDLNSENNNGIIFECKAAEVLKVLLERGASDKYEEIFLRGQPACHRTMFMVLVSQKKYDMARILLLSGRAKGIREAVIIATHQGSKFALEIEDYLRNHPSEQN